jgi:hypothetical protein
MGGDAKRRKEETKAREKADADFKEVGGLYLRVSVRTWCHGFSFHPTQTLCCMWSLVGPMLVSLTFAATLALRATAAGNLPDAGRHQICEDAPWLNEIPSRTLPMARMPSK